MFKENHFSAAQCVGLLSKNFRQYCDEFLEPYGLTNGFYLYLIYIHYNPGCSLVDLKDGLHVDKAHVTRVVSKLCRMNYLSKEKRDEDGRSWCLSLTGKGEEVFTEIHGLPLVWNETMLSCLTEEEKSQFQNLLLKVCMDIGVFE